MRLTDKQVEHIKSGGGYNFRSVMNLIDTIEARQGEISALEACCEKLKKQNMRIIKQNMGMRESLKQAREALKAAWTESNEPWEEAYEKGMEALAAIDKIGGMRDEVDG